LYSYFADERNKQPSAAMILAALHMTLALVSIECSCYWRWSRPASLHQLVQCDQQTDKHDEVAIAFTEY